MGKQEEKETVQTVDYDRIVRLKEVLKKLGINQIEFAEKIGISDKYISHMLAGYRPISDKNIKKIVATYPEINYIWMLTGGGPMYIGKDGMSFDDLVELVKELRTRIEVLEGGQKD
jgi:transcriptional regulator with XRE-family HTH domain